MEVQPSTPITTVTVRMDGPNTATSTSVAGAVLTESSLSFLGMGVQTPQASWGNIIFAAQNLLVLTARP